MTTKIVSDYENKPGWILCFNKIGFTYKMCDPTWEMNRNEGTIKKKWQTQQQISIYSLELPLLSTSNVDFYGTTCAAILISI